MYFRNGNLSLSITLNLYTYCILAKILYKLISGLKLKKMHTKSTLISNLAAALGFEPRQTESESAVLPLHNAALLTSLYTEKNYKSSCFVMVACPQ